MAIDRRPPRPTPAAAAARCRGHSAARLLPWIGSASLAAAAALLLTLLLVAPREAFALAAACALLALGKEAAVPAGLLLGGDPWLVALQLLLVDAGGLLLLAPRVTGRSPPAMVAAAARRRNGARRPTTLAALYRRAMAPFAFLGPLVALLMGEAAGLPERRLPPVVAAASATALLGWCGLYALGFQMLGTPALVAALAVAVPLALLGATVSLVGSRRGARVAGAVRG
jgi:hypothetical protein